jgi:citrate synthase
MIGDPTMRIARPRQLYTGPVKREYKVIAERG